MVAHHCEIPLSPCQCSESLSSLAVRERYENRCKNGHHRFLSRVTANKKSARVSALTIECEICCVLLIGNHFPMQKCSKIFPSTSSVVTSPRMVPRWWRAWRRSSERRSGVWPAARERLTFSRDSDAFIRAW